MRKTSYEQIQPNPTVLLLLRVSVFVVMLVWTIDKFVRPEHAISIFEHVYFVKGVGATVV